MLLLVTIITTRLRKVISVSYSNYNDLLLFMVISEYMIVVDDFKEVLCITAYFHLLSLANYTQRNNNDI